MTATGTTFQLPPPETIWNVGATEVVSWLGAEPADIWLSVDGGNAHSLLRENVGGSASNAIPLVVPHQPTYFAQFKVVPHDASVTGIAVSDSLFTIEASIALLKPAGGAGGTVAGSC